MDAKKQKDVPEYCGNVCSGLAILAFLEKGHLPGPFFINT